MSFSFSQALISETCPLTQPMGSDGQSQDYERESQLSQEQFSQELLYNQGSQGLSRPASQDFNRQGLTRQCSIPGWASTSTQQESVSLLNTSQEIGWPGQSVRRTLPRHYDSQQESISLLANSQDLNWPESSAPRRTLPRPPTWPRINTTGRPLGGVGRNTLQGIGRSREADSGGVQDRVGGQRAARWRLPALASNKENAGQSAAKERDLRHHLSEVSKQVSKMPTSVSKLLEEAVRFLDSSHTTKQGELKESLNKVLDSLKELADQSGDGGGDNSGSELMQSLQLVRESFLKEGDRVRGIEEMQEILTKELVGLKEEMKKNFEALERLCQQKEAELKQQADQAIERRRSVGSLLRRTSRPLLLSHPGRGGTDQMAVGNALGNQIRNRHQNSIPSSMILPRPGVFPPGKDPSSSKPIFAGARTQSFNSGRSLVPSKVACVLPSRPRHNLHLDVRGTPSARDVFQPTSNVNQTLQQSSRKEAFDVFALDTDSDSSCC